MKNGKTHHPRCHLPSLWGGEFRGKIMVPATACPSPNPSSGLPTQYSRFSHFLQNYIPFHTKHRGWFYRLQTSKIIFQKLSLNCWQKSKQSKWWIRYKSIYSNRIIHWCNFFNFVLQLCVFNMFKTSQELRMGKVSFI